MKKMIFFVVCVLSFNLVALPRFTIKRVDEETYKRNNRLIKSLLPNRIVFLTDVPGEHLNKDSVGKIFLDGMANIPWVRNENYYDKMDDSLTRDKYSITPISYHDIYRGNSNKKHLFGYVFLLLNEKNEVVKDFYFNHDGQVEDLVEIQFDFSDAGFNIQLFMPRSKAILHPIQPPKIITDFDPYLQLNFLDQNPQQGDLGVMALFGLDRSVLNELMQNPSLLKLNEIFFRLNQNYTSLLYSNQNIYESQFIADFSEVLADAPTGVVPRWNSNGHRLNEQEDSDGPALMLIYKIDKQSMENKINILGGAIVGANLDGSSVKIECFSEYPDQFNIEIKKGQNVLDVRKIQFERKYIFCDHKNHKNTIQELQGGWCQDIKNQHFLEEQNASYLPVKFFLHSEDCSICGDSSHMLFESPDCKSHACLRCTNGQLTTFINDTVSGKFSFNDHYNPQFKCFCQNPGCYISDKTLVKSILGIQAYNDLKDKISKMQNLDCPYGPHQAGLLSDMRALEQPYIYCGVCGKEICSNCNKKYNARHRCDTDIGVTFGNDIKPCPLCGTGIEKNEGCKNMLCGGNTDSNRNTAQGCGHCFCWQCGKYYKPTPRDRSHIYDSNLRKYFDPISRQEAIHSGGTDHDPTCQPFNWWEKPNWKVLNRN